MNSILTLIGKDFRVFWKDKIAFIMTFVVPMVLMTIFGIVFGGLGGGGGGGPRVMVVDQAQSEASKLMIEALMKDEGLRIYTTYWTGEGEAAKELPLTEQIARDRLATNADDWRFGIIFPEDFEKEDFGFRLKYLYNPRSTVEYQIVTGLMQKTFFSNAFPILQQNMTSQITDEFGPERVVEFQDRMATLVSEQFGGSYEDVRSIFPEGSVFPDLALIDQEADAETGEDSEEEDADFFSFLLDLEDEQIAGKGKPPAAQTVGSWAVMFLLFTMTGAASALFEERDHGVFHRLLSGPVSRSHVLWSKYVFLWILGVIQITVLLAYGQLVFGVITSVDQVLPLITVCGVGIAASTGFGMILCAFSKSPAQANGFGTLLILPMSALGGAMLPAFMLPAVIRDYVSPLTLVHWMMNGILKVLWEDATVADLWLNLVVLGGITVGTLSIALWQFRRGDLFR